MIVFDTVQIGKPNERQRRMFEVTHDALQAMTEAARPGRPLGEIDDAHRRDALSARHGFFTRKGGASSGIFAGLNCGTGSSDQAEIVAINRARVADALGLEPEGLVSVHQVHSPDVVTVLAPIALEDRPPADAMVTNRPGLLLGILTEIGRAHV